MVELSPPLFESSGLELVSVELSPGVVEPEVSVVGRLSVGAFSLGVAGVVSPQRVVLKSS